MPVSRLGIPTCSSPKESPRIERGATDAILNPGSPVRNEEIAKEWRSQAVSSLEWRPCANQAGAVQGEAGGYFVEADGFPRRCYLKPANAHQNAEQVSRAAREKIASDLAYDLGLPVPPAVLTTRDPVPPGCESAVVVSLIMYPRQWAWEHVRTHPDGDSPAALAMAHVFAACSPMLAFDTWLHQVDHADHPHNVIWGYDPAKPADSRIVFLDFAFSMGFQGDWNGDAWKNVQPAGFPGKLRTHLDTEALRSAVESIERFPDESLREIVGRIPPTHLPESQRVTILQGLFGRRRLLADAFRGVI
jgi:hypothetical protein